jgi:hypothetical protein
MMQRARAAEKARRAAETEARKEEERRKVQQEIDDAAEVERLAEIFANIFLAEGYLCVRNKKKGDMKRFFVLRQGSVLYYESKSDYEDGAEYRGHIRCDEIVKIIPAGLGFRLYTIHSKKSLDLYASGVQDHTRWAAAWGSITPTRLQAELITEEGRHLAATKLQGQQRRLMAMNRVKKIALDVARKIEQAVAEHNTAFADMALPWKRQAKSVINPKRFATFVPPIVPLGAPPPKGWKSSKNQALCNPDDMVFAFKMIDTANVGKLDRLDSHNVFRCLGWCIDSKKLDDMLDEVDVEGLSAAKAIRKPKRLRGPWSLERLTRAAELLKERCDGKQAVNGDIDRLRRAMSYLSSDDIVKCSKIASFGNPMTPDDFKNIVMGSEGRGFSLADHKLMAETIHMGGALNPDSISANNVAMRIVDRIVNPASALDLSPEQASFFCRPHLTGTQGGNSEKCNRERRCP